MCALKCLALEIRDIELGCYRQKLIRVSLASFSGLN